MNEHAPAERFVEQLTEIVGADGVRSGAAVAALDPGFEPRNLAAGLMARPRDAAQAALRGTRLDERALAVRIRQAHDLGAWQPRGQPQ